MEENLTVVEDRKYLHEIIDKQRQEIQDNYTNKIIMEEEKYVDPKHPNKEQILTTK